MTKRKGSFLIAIIAESVQRRWTDYGKVHHAETPNGLLLIGVNGLPGESSNDCVLPVIGARKRKDLL